MYKPNRLCESVNKIIDSESKFLECNNKLFCCEIQDWLEKVPNEEKRIRLYNDLLESYADVVCCISNLVCSSSALLKNAGCNDECNKGCKGSGIYIICIVIVIDKCRNRILLYYLVYDKGNEKFIMAKFNPIYCRKGMRFKVYYLR